MLAVHKPRHRTVNVDGVEVFYREAGRPDAPALLLIHGFPNSSFGFHQVMSPLAEVARVVAPDLPGFGLTEVPDGYTYTFDGIGRTIDAFTRAVGLERFFLYVHDFGAPVAYHLALTHPDRILGLVVQSGNAHEEGLGESWDAARAYWADPSPQTRAALPEWLDFEGTRYQYLGGLPPRLEALPSPEAWILDWERMRRPGMVEVQFAIFADYASHVARFPEISAWLRRHQPPTLLFWGRHDPFFDVAEVLAYHRELDRLEMHIYDGAHLLLETHHQECAALMRHFILDVSASLP